MISLLNESLPLPQNSSDQSASADNRPNIVLIVADDLHAWSIDAMPHVGSLLKQQGTTFSRFFVTTPVCGPSRASILTGQYAHNHGILRNNGDRGGFHTFYLIDREASTIATRLQAAGYRIALVGKYLNGYPRIPQRISKRQISSQHMPPGWDEWHAVIGRQVYESFGYKINENSRLVAYGNQPGDYLTDVLTDLPP